VPIFLQIPGVQGESTDSAHQQWIDLNTLSFGVGAPIVATGAPGPPRFDMVVATKAIDSTSFGLYEMALTHKVVNGAVIEFTALKAPPGAQSIIYVLELRQGVIASIVSQVQPSEGAGVDTIQFSCNQLQWTSKAIPASGQAVASFTTGWDVAANRTI
jgi:type VI secretion system secreted protein Hcp